MVVESLLQIDLRVLIDSLERKTGVKLPRKVIEVYLDDERDLLFIRFKEPKKVEVGEPLSTEAVATLFTDEDTKEVTALEIIEVSELLKELKIY
ncbi:MAG: hypothetical protein GU359_01730 [Desulfurococcales archaeon]|jgi:hypothetical protein|nr:hypothetical protein [Desulfurococcales archaeon]